MNRLTSGVSVLAVVAVLVVVAGVAASPAAAEACPVPQLDGFVFQSLTADNVPCPEAHELALHVVRPRLGPVPADWRCTATVSGRNVLYACVDRLIASRRVDFTYYVL
jgi:hypothetical protein